MDRKKFIQASALAVLGGGAMLSSCKEESATSTGAVSSSKTYKWKMVTTWPPGFPVLGEGATMLAKWIEEMSAGRIKIRVYGGGELVPALEAFDAVSSGSADIGSGAAYYQAGKTSASQFFASVPFGMNAQQVNAWIYSGGGQALWEEVYAPFNVQPFLGGNTGVQMGGWFNKEINSIDDFKGLKMRIPGLGGKVVERAGGSSITMAGGEIYTNLETGVIDATEWIGPYHDFKMGFADIAKYYYAPGWHEPGTALEVFINKDRYNELPADLQAIVRSACARLNIWTLSEFEAQNNAFLQKLVNEKNVELRTFSAETLAALRSITDEVIGEITANDPVAKKVFTAYSAFKKQVSAWSEVTEKAFYDRIQA
jgi:TRAP-type mannitol/chloroaromatic compound transport system substrate-binding protein